VVGGGVHGEKVDGEVGLVGACGAHGGHGVVPAPDAVEVPGGAKLAHRGGHDGGVDIVPGEYAEGTEHGGVFPSPLGGKGVLSFVQ